MSEPIVILGASARAAAYSAARAGFAPWAVDLFADADLVRLCPVHRIARYPCDLVAAARRAPPGPWLYTGGLENYPRVVERIAAERWLYGNPGQPLRIIRDPWQLSALVRAAGLSFPELASTAAGLARDGSWLRKAVRSSGGLRVESWHETNPAADETRGWYFQARIAGQSCAAVFVAADGAAQLLGVTHQWIGGDGQLGSLSHAPPYHYAGSLGPLQLASKVRRQLQDLGNTLADRAGLVGLFGVDFILADDTVWPIEVNPRFPASVEVLERALGFSAVGCHVAACRGELPSPIEQPVAGVRLAGKVVVYCRSAGQLSESVRQRLDAESQSPTPATLADVPASAGEMLAGQPVVTLLADGATRDEVVAQLDRRIAQLQLDLAPVVSIASP